MPAETIGAVQRTPGGGHMLMRARQIVVALVTVIAASLSVTAC